MVNELTIFCTQVLGLGVNILVNVAVCDDDSNTFVNVKLNIKIVKVLRLGIPINNKANPVANLEKKFLEIHATSTITKSTVTSLSHMIEDKKGNLLNCLVMNLNVEDQMEKPTW